MWSLLVKFPCALENNYMLLLLSEVIYKFQLGQFGCSVIQVVYSFTDFLPTYSMTWKRILKSSTKIVDLFIYNFNSLIFCFMNSVFSGRRIHIKDCYVFLRNEPFVNM